MRYRYVVAVNCPVNAKHFAPVVHAYDDYDWMNAWSDFFGYVSKSIPVIVRDMESGGFVSFDSLDNEFDFHA